MREAFLSRDWKATIEVAGRWRAAVDKALLLEDRSTPERLSKWRPTRVWLEDCGGQSDWYAARAVNALGDWRAALERIDRIPKQWPDARAGTRSYAHSFRASILIDQGLPDLALMPLAQAMRLCDEEIADDKNRDYAAFFDAYLGEAERLLAIGRFRETLTQLERAEAKVDWEKATAKMGSVRANASRARIESIRGTAWTELARADVPARAEARAAYTRVLENGDALLSERIFAASSLMQISLSAAEIERATTERDVMVELRTEQGGAADLEDDAWAAALCARLARLRGEDHAEAHAELRAKLAQLVEAWRDVERPGGVGFLRYTRAQMCWVEALLGVPEPEALALAIQAQEFGVLWRALGGPQPNVDALRASLCPQGTGCLLFVTGPDESVVLAFDAGRVQRKRINSVTWFESCEADLRTARLRAQSKDASARAKLNEVFSTLAHAALPPEVLEWIGGWKHVRVIGREHVSASPMQTWPVSEARPLGAAVAISESPSLPVAYALIKRAGASTVAERSVLITAPQPAEEVRKRFSILTKAELTADRVRPLVDAFAAQGFPVRVGADASIDALANARRDAGGVFVLAHGVQDRALELGSFVVFSASESARDGLLSIEGLRRLELPDLVVFLVCRAADGAERVGDAGASDLAGAALIARASTVIASQRDLMLSDALEYARTFVEQRNAGVSSDEAARRTLAKLFADDPTRNFETLPFVYGTGR